MSLVFCYLLGDMGSWIPTRVECDYLTTIASHWVFSETLKSPKNIQRKCKFMDDRNIFYTSLLCIFFRIKRTQHKSFYCCSWDCKLISLYQKANKVKMIRAHCISKSKWCVGPMQQASQTLKIWKYYQGYNLFIWILM